jgi:Protein of unknown function (DUF3293)
MPNFDRQLKSAFADTDYTALLPDGPVVLRVGVPCAALQALMIAHNVELAGYITAFNPYSQVVSLEDNQLATHLLEQRLITSNLPYWPCDGKDPEGLWPSEPGYLILGADRRWLRRLGRRFRQHALLVCRRTGRPTLLWTRHS